MAEINNTAEIEMLEFEVGSAKYGIDIGLVTEIMTNVPVTPVPDSRQDIEGIFIPRDELITVIDLYRVFGVIRCEGEKKLFIVCHIGDAGIALHVTAVKGLIMVKRDDILPPGELLEGKKHPELFKGVIKTEHGIILVPDIESIIR